MEPDRWHCIERLFEKARKHPPDAWHALLAEACGPDEPLRREVLALLEADAQAGGFLDGTAAEILPGFRLPAPDPPGQVGPYRVVRLLGRGGMGCVYLAEDERVGRRVALKLIRPGAAGGEVLLRFLAEREVLARLEHAHIARLYDAGATADGAPYFAMELVSGRPLDAFCREEALGLEGRLRLFLQVCAAVHYAHRSLVLHRDLKPSNVLVHRDVEGQPQATLLDFGLAKLLAPEGAAGPAPTETVARRLTLPYASPEQVLGGRLTPASDVYALGVILYSLLADAAPYDVAGTAPYLLERATCEAEPVPPSRRAGHAGTSARQLRGDLDAIVLKALRKDPDDRYPTAEALADDIRRHLTGRPVRARRQTWRYRGGRLLRRHRGRIGAAAAIGLLALTVAALALRLVAGEVDRRPALLRYEGASLLVLNRLGEPLDRVDVGAGEVQEHRRRPFVRRSALADLDGDGTRELLYVAPRTGGGSGLYAKRVGADTLLWATEPAIDFYYPRRPDARGGPVAIRAFVAGDLDGDGAAEVVATGQLAGPCAFPTFVAKYDARTGRPMGEVYRHAGGLGDLEAADLDGDGVQELLLTGGSQHHRDGVLVVLDSRHLHGHAPSGGVYTSPDYGAGLERAYVRLPRSILSEHAGARFVGGWRVEATGGRVTVEVQDLGGEEALPEPLLDKRLRLFLTFGPDLTPGPVGSSDDWDALAERLHREGAVGVDATRSEYLDGAYRSGLRWWDGDGWVAEPAVNRHWAEAVRQASPAAMRVAQAR